MANRPAHEIRRGMIVVRIWVKRTRSGKRHTVSIVRLFRNGDDWKESTRFSGKDVTNEQRKAADLEGWILGIM